MKIMEVKSELSPIKGKKVSEKVFKAFFSGNSGSREDLLKRHLLAACCIEYEQEEEHLIFYQKKRMEFLFEDVRDAREAIEAMNLGKQASYAGCKMDQNPYCGTGSYSKWQSWRNGHKIWEVIESEIFLD